MTNPQVERLRAIEAARDRRRHFIRQLTVPRLYLPILLLVVLPLAFEAAPLALQGIIAIAAVCALIGLTLLFMAGSVYREIEDAERMMSEAFWLDGFDEYQRSRNRGEDEPIIAPKLPQ